MTYLLAHMAAYLVAALVVGFGMGWLMRRSSAHDEQATLQRQLVELKSRVPQLETAVRHREQQIARFKEELDVTTGKFESLSHAVQDRERTIGDRDRTLSLLRSEIALLKQGAAAEPDYADLSRSNDLTVRELEDRLRERDAQIADFARRLAENVARPGGASPETIKRIRELEVESGARAHEVRQLSDGLHDRDKRIKDLDRERERQDKWMGVLTGQLETSRETNRRLNEEASEARAARERIRALEGEIARLATDVAERDRRLTASRFELSTARAMVADLQGRLGGQGVPQRGQTPS